MTYTTSLSLARRIANFFRLSWLVLVLPAVVFATGSKDTPKNGCVFFDDRPVVNAPAEAGEEEADGDAVKEIPGIRAPLAEEIGPAPAPPRGPLKSIPPLPGLPLDTTWDSVGWYPQGMAPGKGGDLNIAPDHPSAGCVSAIVPHPSNQNIIYIGTVNGGVWRTDNALASDPRWKPLTDDQQSLSIGGLALDPTDASGNTLVAGFGRRSSIAQLGGAHKGLIRTTDGGSTWTAVGATALAGRQIHYVVVKGQLIMVSVEFTDNGTATGLYRTIDGGANWDNVSGFANSGLPAGAVDHLTADPNNSNRYYCHVTSNGVYRSDNGGAVWTNISAGMAAANVSNVALAVGSDGAVFAAELAGTSRVYRSANAGANWTQMDSIQANTSNLFNGFVVDRSNSNLVYLSGLYLNPTQFPFEGRIVRGNAAAPTGSQWTSIASTSTQGIGTAPHTDSRALAMTIGNRLIEGDDGGVYELNIADVGSQGDGTGGGGMWRSLNSNLQDGELHDMSYDPVARIFFGGGQDTGLLEQIKSGETKWNTTSTGDGGDTALDLLTSPGQSIRYGSNQYGTGFRRRTLDANNNQVGSTAFPPLSLVGGGTAPVLAAPANGGNVPFVMPTATNAVAGGRLIVSGNNNVYESTDQGSTVKQIDTVAAANGAKIAYGGRLSGANVPDVLFYGSGGNIRYRTVANGAISSVAIPAGVGTVQGVVFDPENWKTAYVISTNAVFLANDIATNGAGGFTNITGNLTGVGTFHTLAYLTLPSGNAVMVGADLGAYIMRVNSPGVWQTLGDNLPHAPVFDSHFDAAGQVLAVSLLGRGAWLYDFKQTKATGQYGETFQAYVPGPVTLPATTGELFSTHLGTAASAINDDFRELRLTAVGTTFTRTAFRLPDLNPGHAVAAFSAKWNTLLTGDANQLADGFSFNFGPLGGISATNFTNATYNHEDGFNAGLTVSVRTYSGNTPGYYVRVNGTTVANGFASKPSTDWGSFSTIRHFFEVDWRIDTGLTLRVDGVAIFTNLPTPGYLPAVGDRFVFGARTGAFYEDMRLDNIAIFTGGVLAPIQAVAPYYFSSQNPPNETADKAFDGDLNTKWLGTNYTGYLGASFPSSKTIRLYTFTSANDVPARYPVMWDFQTGDDGVLWTQRGTQSNQWIANAFETHAFVVANPTAASKFRVLISSNRDDPSTQLAEFQPWEFIPVGASFTVTNSNDAGPGSLRQAIADAATFPGQSTITFIPALAGQTITLTSGPLVVNNPDGVLIDASNLAAGLTISGNNASGIMTVSAAGVCTVNNVTFTGGNAADGGAVNNQGSLNLNKCTLSGNVAQRGGALLNNTPDFFTHTSTLTYCTVSGNTASAIGGGIYTFNGRTTLIRCTVAANTAPAGQGSGVASYGDTFTETQVRDSIIAQNVNSDVDFVLDNSNNSFTSLGFNIVGTGTAVPDFNAVADQVTAPLLAPLDNYGGPTKTMALILGSPARNNGSNLATSSDQRGFPIVGFPDIGAYEAGTFSNYNAYIWESLPFSATILQHDTAFDFDGDGTSNFAEYVALTNPNDRTSRFRITNVVINGANIELTYTTEVGRHYSFEYGNDLVGWNPVAASVPGTGSPVTTPLGPINSFPKFVIRVIVGP